MSIICIVCQEPKENIISGTSTCKDCSFDDAPEDQHQWYVVGSHESEITKTSGWADLKLECIADHDCGLTACVMINNINQSMIKIDEEEG